MDPAQALMLVQILYGTLTGFLFIFGADILSRYMRADKQARGDAVHLTFLAMGAAMVGYGVYMFTAIASFFMSVIPDWISVLGELIRFVIIAAFALVAEQFVLPKKLRFLKIGNYHIGFVTLLAAIGVVFAAVMLFLEFSDPNEGVYVISWALIPIWGLEGIFGLIAFWGFVQILLIRLSPPRDIKARILLGLFAGAIALGGEIISLGGRSPPGDLWVIGTLIEVLAWLFFRYCFLSIPSYSELDWKGGLIEMHVIMADTGLSLYHRVFQRVAPEKLKGDLEVHTTIPAAARPDSDLTGGAMIGIKGLLSEIAGTKGKLRNIQIGEKNLVFNQGNSIMVLLLADANLGVYHSILYRLVAELEEKNPNLANFDGNLKKLNFAPVLDQYFGALVAEKSDKGNGAEKAPVLKSE